MNHLLSMLKHAILTIFALTMFLAVSAFSMPAHVYAAEVVPSTNTINKYIDYKVKSGNTLGIIAENFGTTVDMIKSVNGLTSDMIYVDQVLKIPASYIDYTVKPGDYLYLISTKFGTSIERIRLFNSQYTDMLYIGQVLHIPNVSTVPYVTYIVHTVVQGDNAWGLSIRYGIPQAELLRANGLTLQSSLSIGQKLKIPVYTIPVTATPGPQYGEYLDWWTQAQYLLPIGAVATVRDFETRTTFNIKRTIGASHADCEPLTAADTAIMLKVWGGAYSWLTRAVIVEDEGRKIAASVSFMPHGIQYIENNNFDGHFDIHFKNSTRHKDNTIDPLHQAKIRIAAGVAP